MAENFNIIDTPWHTTSIISCMVDRGIKTVIRYYGVNTKKHPEKVLELNEAKALSQAGLQISVVFELINNAKDYFNKELGQAHARKAFQLAKQINQPEGSAIYFAVDYDATDDDIENHIKPHFEAIHNTLSQLANGALGYKVGIYGSGKVINSVKADYRWLAESKGWSGYQDAINNKNYELYQTPGRTDFCWSDANKYEIDKKMTETTDIGAFSIA